MSINLDGERDKIVRRHGQIAAYVLLLSAVSLSGCCGAFSTVEYAMTGEFTFPSDYDLFTLIGLGMAWYCWVEAKRMNRNKWLWSLAGLFFGLIPLAILVYSKDLSIDEKME